MTGIPKLPHARAGRRILWLALALALPCAAWPPNPRVGGLPRAKPAEMDGDPHVPGFPKAPVKPTREYVNAFMQAEADVPSEERMLQAFQHPDMGLAVVTFLPRYASPRLVEPARKLARGGDPALQAGAIGGLVGLLDEGPETRTFIRRQLRAVNPAVRGRAAEYLCWLGVPEDYQDLMKAAASERDLHARAAMVEAAAAIKRRASRFGEGPPAALGPDSDPAATYLKMAAALEAQPTKMTRRAVIERLRTTETCEPVTRFADRLEHGERGAALLETQRLLAGYPDGVTASADPAGAPGAVPPVSRTLVVPVRGYFDATRKSYGILIKPEQGTPYTGKYHVGDDAAWQQDHETVVAIGNGIVRSVDLGRKSWGGLVGIEHEDAAGVRFCSLYGHLGPLVCVQPGQVVRQGEKLGAVGLSYSHCNGGYLAHLHFGIHRGAYRRPCRVGETVRCPGPSGEEIAVTVTAVRDRSVAVRMPDGGTANLPRSETWACGYLTPEEFADKAHGWVDPQTLLRDFK